ncbi:MAG: tryptophan--tRNA ligase [Candidatus Abawacabacteria bacterium]|nr:tryptophan--tRNA ligase [Candidatus Abawacabacteria bacterium]
MQIFFSGTKPTGEHTHLGNYFGAIKQFVDLQNGENRTNIYFIANYHALTTERDGTKLVTNTWNILREYIAYGIDPKKSIIFIQSDVPEHTELAWIFNCLTPFGLLERAHAYKDALSKGKEASAGLFAYPVLMAADILIYQSTHVPVGKDQKQHVEIARDIAEKFNHYYGETFVLPQAVIMEETATVTGIDGEKMSKSYHNTISPFEDEKSLVKKIMSLKTDSKGIDEPKDLAGNIIYQYLELVGDEHLCKQVKERFLKGGMGYGEAKKLLAQAMLDYFAPMRKKYHMITQTDLENIVKEGAIQAKVIARRTIDTVRNKVGIV